MVRQSKREHLLFQPRSQTGQSLTPQGIWGFSHWLSFQPRSQTGQSLTFNQEATDRIGKLFQPRSQTGQSLTPGIEIPMGNFLASFNPVHKPVSLSPTYQSGGNGRRSGSFNPVHKPVSLSPLSLQEADFITGFPVVCGPLAFCPRATPPHTLKWPLFVMISGLCPTRCRSLV